MDPRKLTCQLRYAGSTRVWSPLCATQPTVTLTTSNIPVSYWIKPHRTISREAILLGTCQTLRKRKWLLLPVKARPIPDWEGIESPSYHPQKLPPAISNGGGVQQKKLPTPNRPKILDNYIHRHVAFESEKACC